MNEHELLGVRQRPYNILDGLIAINFSEMLENARSLLFRWQPTQNRHEEFVQHVFDRLVRFHELRRPSIWVLNQLLEDGGRRPTIQNSSSTP